MDIESILKAIAEWLSSSDDSYIAYREAYVPSNLDNQRTTGYVTWDFDVDSVEQCSRYQTGVVEGTLDVICYATKRPARLLIYDDIIDTMYPLVSGNRSPAGPLALTNGVYLHWLRWTDTDELFSEKTGHQHSETPGIIVSQRLKLSV